MVEPRMAATAAAMATLLIGGVVAGTALAADTDEPWPDGIEDGDRDRQAERVRREPVGHGP